MERQYLNRIADKILQERLRTSGAVLIEGLNGVERPEQQQKTQKVSSTCKIQTRHSHI